MSSNPEEPILDEMPHVTENLLGATSAACAIATIGILTAYATLDPGKLDSYLQISALMFGFALPMFLAAGVFAIWLRIGTAAYVLLGLGTSVWVYGFFNLLRHVSAESAVVFLLSFVVWLFIVLIGVRASRLQAQRRAVQRQHSEAK